MPSKLSTLRAKLRSVAAWPAGELPVISAYLDLRPQATGENPQLRSGLVVLRDRLRQIERRYAPHTPAHDSLLADRERLDEYIAAEALPDVAGLAVFACHGAERRFESLHTAHELADEVDAGPHPRLLPLARLADEDEAIVALADSNTLRLFARRSGSLEEIGLLDDEPDDYSRADVGGWSQARFQRHVDEHREAFARLAAGAVEQACQREGAQQLVICADELTAGPLVAELPRRTAELVRGTLRLDIRAETPEVEVEVLPFLEQEALTDRQDAADRLVGAVRADGLAVAGVDTTHAALRLGQLSELFLEGRSMLEAELTEELLRLAATTDASIRFVPEHGGLRRHAGVGGLLRFRLNRDVSGPQSAAGQESATLTSSDVRSS